MVSRRTSRTADKAPTAPQQWRRVLALHTAVEQALKVEMRRWGVGLSEYRALELVANAPDHEVRLLDLAEALGLNPSSVSRLVDRLTVNDLVRRESCGDDRRGVFVAITDGGLALLARGGPAYDRALTAALGIASHDEDQAELVAVLMGHHTAPDHR